ncbi:polysaccharide deacetylase family protein [Kineosporia succinea]|uniref:Peptidoglycan/xylan/chitin deacetylase (PgdA/CDA1 family) n=1 Tax=Kineosporia succinea TaxID=84632 RepID=A0ABT9NZU1_9ACTN|nr:polysaccharide deacetylase family protein [Kineosporia succinea]MDP9825951.1 peptidoglycan/xylan/chitin deacetylase (PgdA/CDA1 family) [Kineosporia succinea]
MTSSVRRPVLDLSAKLVRRGYICDYEAGERPLPGADKVLTYGRPALLGVSTVACVATDEKVVSLTYDDGPNPVFTPQILDALGGAGQRATFFVLVEQAERYPHLIQRILRDGHEVALHGIDHTRLSALPLQKAVALIKDGKNRLENVAGRRVTLFRPCYGAQTVGQYLATRALGLEVAIWSAWARDWEGVSAEVIAERAIGALHQGGFVLLHDHSGDGVGAEGLERGEATRLLMRGMAEKGYTSRTVTELLNEYPAVRTVWAEKRDPNRADGGMPDAN